MERRQWRDTTTTSQLFMNPCGAVNGLTPHLVMDWTPLLKTFFLCVCSMYPLVSESLFLAVEVTTGWHRPHPKPPGLSPPTSFPQKQASKERKLLFDYLLWLSHHVQLPVVHRGCPQIPVGCLPWFHVSAWRGFAPGTQQKPRKDPGELSPHVHTGMNIFLSNFLRMIRVQIIC